MALELYAQPYDITAVGFYFDTARQFNELSGEALNDFGQRVEEYEIQFVDGQHIDFELARVWQINQANFVAFLDAAAEWDNDRKRRYIIAVGECGYDHSQVADDPENEGIDIYYLDSLQELAESFVDEGLFGEVPEALAAHIDYESIARDLSVDFSEIEIAGERLVYACR